MMYDTGHAFGVIARATEGIIERSGLRAVGGNRRELERWISYKNVSHFNLHQCYESFIKCIRAIERIPTPNIHPLAKLFDGLSSDSTNALERAYQETVWASSETGISLCFSPVRPGRIPPRRVVSLRDMLSHWDGPFGLHKKRYQWEQAGAGKPMQFLDDMTPYFNLMERVDSRVAEMLRREHARVQSQTE